MRDAETRIKELEEKKNKLLRRQVSIAIRIGDINEKLQKLFNQAGYKITA